MISEFELILKNQHKTCQIMPTIGHVLFVSTFKDDQPALNPFRIAWEVDNTTADYIETIAQPQQIYLNIYLKFSFLSPLCAAASSRFTNL